MRTFYLSLALSVGMAWSAFAEEPRLYDELGGAAKLNATVEEFVDIMLEDKRINFAFAQADLRIFKERLYTQLCALAGGPCDYEGRDMKAAHEKLAIDNAQFNALAEDMYKAMERAGVNYRAQNKLMALLAPMQKDIVRKK
jgi:hemoglobin